MTFASANDVEQAKPKSRYLINTGDVIAVYVWNEENFTHPQILVRPDGFISLPVIGEIPVGGHTAKEVETSVTNALQQYVRDTPNVTVSVVSINGNAIYVLGKVNRPGQYPMIGSLDITQALALAGGLNAFAKENSIKVLRRDENGEQHAIKFKYGRIKKGKSLDTNLRLSAGDVIIVP